MRLETGIEDARHALVAREPAREIERAGVRALDPERAASSVLRSISQATDGIGHRAEDRAHAPHRASSARGPSTTPARRSLCPPIDLVALRAAQIGAELERTLSQRRGHGGIHAQLERRDGARVAAACARSTSDSTGLVGDSTWKSRVPAVNARSQPAGSWTSTQVTRQPRRSTPHWSASSVPPSALAQGHDVIAGGEVREVDRGDRGHARREQQRLLGARERGGRCSHACSVGWPRR